jgi:hypothetical protein
MDPAIGLTPYDVHKHVGFLKHLMIRTGRYGIPSCVFHMFYSDVYLILLVETLI